MRIYQILISAVAFVALVAATACEKSSPEPEPTTPKVEVTAGTATQTTIEFTLSSADAEQVSWVCLEATAVRPDAATLLSTGVEVEPNKVLQLVAEELQPATEYAIVAAARNGDIAQLSNVVVVTTAPVDEPEPAPDAVITLEEGGADFESLTFFVTVENATEAKYVHVATGSREVTAEAVMTNGTTLPLDERAEVRIEGLEPTTSYSVYVAAKGADERLFLSDALEIVTTEKPREKVTYTMSAETTASVTKSDDETLSNYYITMYDIATDYTLKLDLYTAVDNLYLPSGDYLLGGFAEGEMSASYTTFLPASDATMAMKFVSGALNIVATPDEQSGQVHYTINGELLFENEDSVVVAFDGYVAGIELPREEPLPDDAYTFVVDPSTRAPYRMELNNENAGDYTLRFYNHNWDEFTVTLVSPAAECNDGKDALPAGKYSLEEGTVRADNTYISLYSPYWASTTTLSATANVQVEGDVYTMKIVVVAENSSGVEKTLVLEYTGAIAQMVR